VKIIFPNYKNSEEKAKSENYFIVRDIACLTVCEIKRSLCVKHQMPVPKWGHAVAQLVEAPRYKPEDHGFDSRWCHWNFSLT